MPLDFLPTDQELIDILKIGAMILAVVLGYSYRYEILGFGRRTAARYLVKPYPSDYVDSGDNEVAVDRNFRTSRQEAEAEAAPEKDAELLVITEKALQMRLDAKFEEGMIHAFAAMHKGGYLPTGKATEIKKALFGVGGGRRLQSLNDAIDAVEMPGEEPTPEAVKPVSGAPKPAGQVYAGEQARKMVNSTS
jgi:hypothetical protein